MKPISRLISASILLMVTGHICAAPDEMIKQGEEIFMAQCEYCHGDGLEKGGTARLQQRYQGVVPALLQERTNLTPEFIRVIVRQWSLGMPAFRPTEITDTELEALIAYLTRNN